MSASAARSPRRTNWCAATACRPAPPPSPRRRCGSRCCRVLLGERHARGLAMGAQRQRIGLLGLERFYKLGPQEARGAELGHLHEEVHADAEEERQARREGVDVESLGLGGADVFEAICKSKCQLLNKRRAGL